MKRGGGFTLIEALLASSLLALLLALLFSILEVGGRFWSRTEAQLEPLLGDWTLERFLRTTLSRATSWNVEGEHFSFEGEGDRLAFIATLPYAPSVGPLRFQLYREGGRLLVEVVPIGGEAERGEHLLLEGVKRLAFRYFGSELAGGEPSWHERWEGEPLPLLVEVVVEQEGVPPWPPIVLSLRQSAPLAAFPARPFLEVR